MGSFTESFNLFWFTKQTGKAVSTAEREARSQDHKFIRCELDGYIPEEKANMDEIRERYYWQCQHQNYVTEAEVTYLSVLFGNSKWECIPIPRSPNTN